MSAPGLKRPWNMWARSWNVYNNIALSRFHFHIPIFSFCTFIELLFLYPPLPLLSFSFCLFVFLFSLFSILPFTFFLCLFIYLFLSLPLPLPLSLSLSFFFFLRFAKSCFARDAVTFSWRSFSHRGLIVLEVLREGIDVSAVIDFVSRWNRAPAGGDIFRVTEPEKSLDFAGAIFDSFGFVV